MPFNEERLVDISSPVESGRHEARQKIPSGETELPECPKEKHYPESPTRTLETNFSETSLHPSPTLFQGFFCCGFSHNPPPWFSPFHPLQDGPNRLHPTKQRPTDTRQPATKGFIYFWYFQRHNYILFTLPEQLNPLTQSTLSVPLQIPVWCIRISKCWYTSSTQASLDRSSSYWTPSGLWPFSDPVPITTVVEKAFPSMGSRVPNFLRSCHLKLEFSFPGVRMTVLNEPVSRFNHLSHSCGSVNHSLSHTPL